MRPFFIRTLPTESLRFIAGCQQCVLSAQNLALAAPRGLQSTPKSLTPWAASLGGPRRRQALWFNQPLLIDTTVAPCRSRSGNLLAYTLDRTGPKPAAVELDNDRAPTAHPARTRRAARHVLRDDHASPISRALLDPTHRTPEAAPVRWRTGGPRL